MLSLYDSAYSASSATSPPAKTGSATPVNTAAPKPNSAVAAQGSSPASASIPNASMMQLLQLTVEFLKLAMSDMTSTLPGATASPSAAGGSLTPTGSPTIAGTAASSPGSGAMVPTGGQVTTAPSQPATSSAPTAPAIPVTGKHQPVVAEIDDFTTDNTGFNHGAEIANTLNPDGSVNVLKFNIGGSGDRLAKIANSLDTVIARVKNGETIDAVNLSQQDFSNSPETAQVRAKIDELAALGVPVAVAAGNNGPSQHNSLISNKAFAVQSATNGLANPNSGLGNVTAEGRTTSFATANFTRQLAFSRASRQQV